MSLFGIESAAFHTSHYFIDLATLAQGRGVEKDKYYLGLGQYQMAVPPPDEDIVTLGANAAKTALRDQKVDEIGLLLFATESGIDQSKSAGMYLHRLLHLSSHCRVLELKQACYSGTGGLLLALDWLKTHPHKKALIVASDIARYGLGTPGESSQGGGAVALLLSAHPCLVAFEEGTGIHTEEAMDFWRPNYRDEALVDGKYSCELYLKALKEAWHDYEAQTGRHFEDHDYFLFHTPFPRLAEKGLQKLCITNHRERPSEAELHRLLDDALAYGRTIGNCYTASLYVGLISLLEHRSDLAGKRLGMYSYGSGCIGEFFSGQVLPNYEKHLFTAVHQEMLGAREELDLPGYEAFYRFEKPTTGETVHFPTHQKGGYRLKGLKSHQRIYGEIKPVTARAPAKLILTGEHAILHGVPAIAMAINCYCDTTISPSSTPRVLFNLANLDHKRERTLHHLRRFKAKIEDSYHQFLAGDRSIRSVLKKPFHLLEYTATAFLEKMDAERKEGFSVHTHSNIPEGFGLGSSAAAIVSTNYALNIFTEKHLSLDQLFELNLEAENLQHGRASGLDIYVSAHGGMVRFCHDKKRVEPLTWPSFPLTLILTGQPESTTGECVTHTKAFLDQHPELIAEFEAVSQKIYQALNAKDFDAFKWAITQNERLLETIGVVPDRVRTLIHSLEAQGLAAKVCGAGAISGDNAGVVAVFGDFKTVSKALPADSSEKLMDISIDLEGVRVLA